VTRLITPTATLHDSFLAALREVQAQPTADSWIGSGSGLDADVLTDTAAFEAYVARVCAEAFESTPRPVGYVPATTWWAIDDDGDYVGTVQIRHRLTDALREVGGHIGYEVRPSARRQGHATRMLALALPLARELGLNDALVSCDDTNIGSRKVIEANGGRADTPVGHKLRYWLTTA
jgi:predicted acetyltransferase